MIETNRLVIRPFLMNDVEAASVYLLDPQTMYYIPETFPSIQEVQDFFKVKATSYYAIECKKTHSVIGHLYFEPFFGDHSYEIGWVLNRAYHHQGFAYEAAFAMCNHAFKFKGIHRIIATCQPENQASWKLMERLKMRREAEFKECIPYQDTWWDEYYYAILASEWHDMQGEEVV